MSVDFTILVCVQFVFLLSLSIYEIMFLACEIGGRLYFVYLELHG